MEDWKAPSAVPSQTAVPTVLAYGFRPAVYDASEDEVLICASLAETSDYLIKEKIRTDKKPVE